MDVYAKPDPHANPYPGVNAHLNSWLQRADRTPIWSGFHHSFTVQITYALNLIAPHKYVAVTEKSRQTPVDLPNDVRLPRAAVVYKSNLHRKTLDQAVCWMEVIFPHDLCHPTYPEQRLAILHNGTVLVEIDLVHESPPVYPFLPAYPHDLNAFPYNVLIADPRPDFQHGRAYTYGFHVDEFAPPILMPLANADAVTFDLNTIYHEWFRRGRWGDFVDYTQPPERFDTYSAEDQARILSIMAQINGGAA
jgi:hypothetical protein